MEKLLASEIEAGKKVKEVRKVINTYDTQKQDFDYGTKQFFKPSIKVQESIKKTIDDKQDELINQLAINDEIANIKQNEIATRLKQNTNKQNELINTIIKAISNQGKQLEYDGDEKISLEPSTSGISLEPSKKSFDLDYGIDEEYKTILNNNKLKLPSKVFENRLNPIDIINNVNKSIKSKSEYIIKNSTKKGKPLQKMKQEQKTRYSKYKKELSFLNNYVKRMNDNKNAYDYIETSCIESK